MKYSYNWLQKHIVETLPSVEKLKETIIFHAFEVESEEVRGEDTILDIKVLPDRAHDCLSHYGMAREIAGLLQLTLKPYTAPALPEVPLALPVEIKSPTCRRYIAVALEGVTVGPSPKWLQEALASIGARSINNVVDATNYVLFDRGQPTHVFDNQKIDGGIIVRLAHPGENVVTLSKEEKVLQESDTVIADYLGALAIAGVKGGNTAEVSEETKNIIIEVANFVPSPIRKTSRKLGLVTDASKRFENDLSPTVAYEAATKLLTLIQELAGGTVVGVADVYPVVQEKKVLVCKPEEIARILGIEVTTEMIVAICSRYNYAYAITEKGVTINIPDERGDIVGVHDFAEEVGRVLGYEDIVPSPLPFSLTVQPSEFDKVRAVKYWLSDNGFREVVTYVFRKKGEIYVSHGAKDKSALRTTLSEGLKESYELNRLHMPLFGLQKIRLFEVGTVFLADREEVHVATVDGGIFEELPIDRFIEKYAISLDVIGSTSAKGIFIPWSPYPFVTRDIAVWVENIEALAVLDTLVTNFASTYCVRDPFIFDRFEKDGRTSIAYRLVFQSFEKTLTEEEVSKDFAVLTKEIGQNPAFSIR